VAVGSQFEMHVFGTLKDKEVEVSLLGGHRPLVTGKLVTVQKDYLIVSVGDGSPENTYVIPTSAVAYIRQTA
jgi:hypothetical protein